MSGVIDPYGRYGNAGKTISTIAILWPVKAIFEKRAATVEVDTFILPDRFQHFEATTRAGNLENHETPFKDSNKIFLSETILHFTCCPLLSF